MQQVDDVGIWKVPQEPSSEELMRDVDEGTPSPESPEKGDGPAVLSPEGRSGAESAPASPQRPLSADAEEDLVNGLVQDGRLLGNGCSAEEAKAQVVPVAKEKEDHRPHQGGPEAASAASPAGQSLDPGKAPAGRQRKLAMEEMLIRDHLGQEVGCMDAVRQSQSSLEKEEELGDHRSLEGRRGSGSQPGPVDGASDPGEALGDGPLGSRDGPEGESPTSQGHRSPSRVLQNEGGCAKGPGDGPLEEGALAEEAGGTRGGQEAVPEEGAPERESTPDLAAGDAPATEAMKQSQGSPGETSESPQLGATEERGVPSHPGSQLEQLTKPLLQQFPPEQERQGLSTQEEAQIPPLDAALPPSPAQRPLLPQDTAPPPPGTTEAVLDQMPCQENQGSLLGPELLLLSHQSPSAPLQQNSSSPERKGSVLDPTPSAERECPSGGDPPALQDPLPSSLEGRPSHAQGESPLPLPDVAHSATDQATSSLQEAERALAPGSPAPPGTPSTSLPDQPTSPLTAGSPGALQCIPSSGHETEGPATQQGQGPLGHQGAGPLPPTPHSLTDQLPSLPEQMVSPPDAQIPALEESPVALQGRMPTPPELRVSPLPEADACLPSQIPPPVTAPGEGPAAVQDQLPPAPQDTESSSPVGENPASSSLQEAEGALPGEIQAPLPSHASPPLPEEEGLPPDQGPAAPGDQAAASLPAQTPSLQEAANSLPEGQNSSDAPEESASVAAHTSPPGNGQGPLLQETPGCPHALPLPQEPLQPLPDKSTAVQELDVEGSGDASVASAGAGEATGVLGDLHAERQPLLQEAKGPGDAAVGDLPPKAGILKPPAATSDQAPNDRGAHSSSNTAYAPQSPAALPRPGPDPEPEKGKRKSCQCCALM